MIWINGKKIYRKVIDLGNSVSVAGNGTWYNTNVSTSGIEIAINAYTIADLSIAFPTLVGIEYDGAKKLAINNGSTRSISFKYIIIEYTKTTN